MIKASHIGFFYHQCLHPVLEHHCKDIRLIVDVRALYKGILYFFFRIFRKKKLKLNCDKIKYSAIKQINLEFVIGASTDIERAF